ncbi:MAG TPA: hypothetical protein VEI57_07290 [Nitrospirota bacterium]|nr:hypothetical protein [Nitrospirota bacterium]
MKLALALTGHPLHKNSVDVGHLIKVNMVKSDTWLLMAAIEHHGVWQSTSSVVLDPILAS